MNRRLTVTTAAFLAAATLAACGGGSGTDKADKPEEHGAPTFAGLCAARDAANEGNTAGAKAIFDHGPLHALAQKAEKVDRAVAAELLESKERVETLTNQKGVDAGVLKDNIDALINATRAAQRASGEPETICGKEAS